MFIKNGDNTACIDLYFKLHFSVLYKWNFLTTICYYLFCCLNCTYGAVDLHPVLHSQFTPIYSAPEHWNHSPLTDTSLQVSDWLHWILSAMALFIPDEWLIFQDVLADNILSL